MLNNLLISFYERDLRRLIEEVNLFKNEEDLWRTRGSVKNSSGNLALHIAGGLNYHIGTNLAQNGYVRNRDQEFSKKDVPRKEIVDQLEALIVMITGTIKAFTQEQMEAGYPVIFDGMKVSVSYILVQLLAHLNYHLGQVNYLRRVFE
jgi:hypothetical protein